MGELSVTSCGAIVQVYTVSFAQDIGSGRTDQACGRGCDLVSDTADRWFQRPATARAGSCRIACPSFGPEIGPIVARPRPTPSSPARRRAAQCNASLPAADDDRLASIGRRRAARGLAVLNVFPAIRDGPERARSSIACSTTSTSILARRDAGPDRELARQGADVVQAYASTPWTVEALQPERL